MQRLECYFVCEPCRVSNRRSNVLIGFPRLEVIKNYGDHTARPLDARHSVAFSKNCDRPLHSPPFGTMNLPGHSLGECLARMRCSVRRCMLRRRAVSETLWSQSS